MECSMYSCLDTGDAEMIRRDMGEKSEEAETQSAVNEVQNILSGVE